MLAPSIHLSEVSYEVPEPIDVSSPLDDVSEASVHMAEETTYELIQKSSQRQKESSLTVMATPTISIRREGPPRTGNALSKTRLLIVKATVIQKGDDFKPGMHSHIHSGLLGAAMVHKVRKEVKEKATYDHFKSAAAFGEKVSSSHAGNNPIPALPSIDSLASCANHLRKKMRPPEPQELYFQLDED